MTGKQQIIWMATAAFFMAGAPAVQAIPMTEADSNTFSYKYDMDVDPRTQDLDGDSNVDWAAHTGISTFAAGVGTFQTRLNGTGTSLWQTSGLSAAANWTIEILAKPVPGTLPGIRGYWGVSTSNLDGSIDWFVDIDEDVVAIRTALTGTDGQQFATDSNSADFVTIRMAQDADGLWVWRGNVLLNPSDPGAPIDISTLVNNRLLIGRYGSQNSGNTQIDHIRLTSGALAPVGQVIPEPASLVLIGLGGLLALRRRA